MPRMRPFDTQSLKQQPTTIVSHQHHGNGNTGVGADQQVRLGGPHGKLLGRDENNKGIARPTVLKRLDPAMLYIPQVKSVLQMS